MREQKGAQHGFSWAMLEVPRKLQGCVLWCSAQEEPATARAAIPAAERSVVIGLEVVVGVVVVAAPTKV